MSDELEDLDEIVDKLDRSREEARRKRADQALHMDIVRVITHPVTIFILLYILLK